MKRIAIHSVPRSGSTWLGTIMDSCPNVNYKYQPLFSFALKSALSATSTKTQIIDFFEKLKNIEDDFMDQKNGKQRGLIPEFQKKEPITTTIYKEVRYHHVLKNLFEQDQEIKVIGLIRNPMAVINSWINAPKEFRPDLGWKVEEEWRFAPAKNQGKCEEFNGFEKWKEVANLFEELKRIFPKRFYLLRYENLLSNTREEIIDLFTFLNLPLTDQTFEFIKKSKSTSVNDAYGVFKKKEKDDSWKNSLPKNIVKEIELNLIGTTLEGYIQ
jgi:hypothetical protein